MGKGKGEVVDFGSDGTVEGKEGVGGTKIGERTDRTGGERNGWKAGKVGGVERGKEEAETRKK